MHQSVVLEKQDGIATIWLNRPERLNAVNTAMVDALIGAVDEAEDDDEVRVLLFSGRGRVFCAGADITDGSTAFTGGPVDSETYRDHGGVLTLRLFECNKPLIAALNGSAAGFGASLVLPMDVRIMATDARIVFPFASRGIVTDAAASWFLPRLVGVERALDWCLTARPVQAQEAFESRLVSGICEAHAVVAEARRIAQSIVRSSAPVSAALTRRMLWNSLGAAHPREAHLMESRAIAYLSTRPDAREGVAAFLEHREPVWTGSVPADVPQWLRGDRR